MWVDEAKKFIYLAEKGDLDVFKESMETMEKIDEKLRLLFENHVSNSKTK